MQYVDDSFEFIHLKDIRSRQTEYAPGSGPNELTPRLAKITSQYNLRMINIDSSWPKHQSPVRIEAPLLQMNVPIPGWGPITPPMS